VNLILIGFRGSGKSTVGPLLAKRLGWRFVDVDALVAQRQGRTLKQIFEQQGEQAFRQYEKEAIESLRKTKDHVIAPGGGAVLDPDVAVLLRRIGRIIWLSAPPAVLWARIKDDPDLSHMRPDLTARGGLAEIEALCAQRDPIYRALAHQILETVSDTADDIAEQIELWFRANDAE
jgi:shikimate kinase